MRNPLRRVHDTVDDERGFTLIELVIASGLMAMVMASLAFTATMAFGDAAISRNRTVASDLANQTLEQVRALPYETLALGLSTSDLASATDPQIVVGGGAYKYRGERIPNGNNASVVPLVPHASTQTIDGAPYTSAVYVTYYNDDPASLSLRVTARVSWTSKLRASVQKFVEAQTIINVSGTGGCGAKATHPYSAPCQPSLYATSSISDGGITFAPSIAGSPAISGLDLALSTMSLAQQSTDLAIEQIDSVTTTVQTSGVSLQRDGQAATTTGQQTVTVGSDSDPSQPKSAYATSSTSTQTATALTLSAGSTSYTTTSSGSDTGTATATILSTVTNACTNAVIPAVNQVDSLPCGNGTTTQGGTMSTQVNAGGLGTATLASIASSVSSAAHANRDKAPQPASCLGTSGDGCVRAAHRQTVGAFRIGGLPLTLAALAPGGFDYFLKMDNYSRTVVAEAGIGNASPSVTSAGTIQYWNGVGYSSLGVSSGVTATIPIQPFTMTDGTTTVSLSGVIRSGGSTAVACASPCADATAEAESPIIGDIRYTIVQSGVTLVDITYHIDLGTLFAHAEYTPGA